MARRRARVATVTLLVLLFPSIIYPVLHRFQQPENVSAFVTGLLFVGALALLRTGKGLTAVSMGLTSVLVLSFVFTGVTTTGTFGLVQPWFLLGPLFAMLQLGPRGGWLAGFVVLGACAVVFALESAGAYVPPVTPRFRVGLELFLGYSMVVPIVLALTHAALSAQGAEHAETVSLLALQQDAERQLAQRRLVSNLAHEIANPLSAAQLSTDFAKSQIEGRQEMAEALSDASSSLRHINALLDDLRLINNMALRGVERVVLAEVVESAVTPLKAALEARAEFALTVVPGVAVTGVRAELERLVKELLRNAVDALPVDGNRGRVSLAVQREGEHVVLTLADEGSGIPDNLRAHLFAPFGTRLQAGQERRGLGLPISQAIVARHRGTLAIDSAEGRGTRCVVRLPVATG